MDVSLPRCSEGVDKIVGIQRVYTNLALNFRVTRLHESVFCAFDLKLDVFVWTSTSLQIATTMMYDWMAQLWSMVPVDRDRVDAGSTSAVVLKVSTVLEWNLSKCNKSIRMDEDRIDMLLPRCSLRFNQQDADVCDFDFELPICNEISWFEYVLHSSRMNTLMDYLLLRCSNSISRIVGIWSSWTAWFSMVSSVTSFAHLMLEYVKIKWPRITCGCYVFPVLCLFA